MIRLSRVVSSLRSQSHNWILVDRAVLTRWSSISVYPVRNLSTNMVGSLLSDMDDEEK